jgi:hypothetical protein
MRGARTGVCYRLTSKRIMQEVVIVATARSAIGRAYRGAFNDSHGATLGGHVVAAALSRAAIAVKEVDDVLMGCALPEGRDRNEYCTTDRIACGPAAGGGSFARDRLTGYRPAMPDWVVRWASPKSAHS